MTNKYESIIRRGLPGGPNEEITFTSGFSTMGYKAFSPDVNNPFNIINSGNITMEGVNFPVMGTDNLGNSKIMMPGMNYQFPGDQVFEVPIANRGREVTIGGKTYNTASKEYRKLVESGKVKPYTTDTESGIGAFNYGNLPDIEITAPETSSYGLRAPIDKTSDWTDGRTSDGIDPEIQRRVDEYQTSLPNIVKDMNKQTQGMAEFTGIPSALRIINNPVQIGKDVVNTAADVGEFMSPLGLMHLLPEETKQKLKEKGVSFDKNILGNPYFSGLEGATDAMLFTGPIGKGVTTGVKAGIKGVKNLNKAANPYYRQLKNTVLPISDEISPGLFHTKTAQYGPYSKWYKAKAHIGNPNAVHTTDIISKHNLEGSVSDALSDRLSFLTGKPKTLDAAGMGPSSAYLGDGKKNLMYMNKVTPPTGSPYYTLPSAFMDSPIDAGRSFNSLLGKLKRGEVVTMDPANSLSLDSYKGFLSRGKGNKFDLTTDAENLIPLNQYSKKWRGFNLKKGEITPEEFYKPSGDAFTLDQAKFWRDKVQSMIDKSKIKPGGIKDVNITHRFDVTGDAFDKGKFDIGLPIPILTKRQKGGIEVPKRQGSIYVNESTGTVSSEPFFENQDPSTHLMRAEKLDDGNWVAFPSLFQNDDGSWVNLSDIPDEKWKTVYEEAKRRGEVIEFGTDKDAAIKFGEGSWKFKMQKGGPLGKRLSKEDRKYIKDNPLKMADVSQVYSIADMMQSQDGDKYDRSLDRYTTIIDKYNDGTPNDTTFMYMHEVPNNFEQFFYNTKLADYPAEIQTIVDGERQFRVPSAEEIAKYKKMISEKSGLIKQKKGGNVSWNFKGKTYSGTLIPSMEDANNRYARTHNGKIKTLPKAQLGLENLLRKGAYLMGDYFNMNEPVPQYSYEEYYKPEYLNDLYISKDDLKELNKRPNIQYDQLSDADKEKVFYDEELDAERSARDFALDHGGIPWKARDVDYKQLSPKSKSEANPYWCNPYQGCLASSYDAYDKLVGQRYTSDEFKSEAKLKEDANLQSLGSRFQAYEIDPDEDGNKQYEFEFDNEPVSAATDKWIRSNKDTFFDDALERWDFTNDSWDIHGKYVDAGGKNIWTVKDNELEKKTFKNLSESEKQELYKQMTPGTIVGFTRSSGVHRGYNEDKGLGNSTHSSQVVGYDEDGTPIIYDYGVYRRIDDDKNAPTYGDLTNLSNITIPKMHLGHNLEWAKEQGLYKTKFEPLNLQIDNMIKAGAYDEQILPFYQALQGNKNSLMNTLKIKPKEYDMFSKMLIGITMEETEGGSGMQHVIEQMIPGSYYQDSIGLTQLMWSNIEGDDKLKKIAKKYKINDIDDLKDPSKNAIASMIYATRNMSSAKKNYEKGRGQKGVRTYYPANSRKQRIKARLGKDPKYDGFIFKTDELDENGKPYEIDFFTGSKNYTLGIGMNKSIENIQAQFDEVAKQVYELTGNDIAGKYTVREKDGEYVVDKVTEGNSKLTPEQMFIYNWNSPNTLRSGDAQGGARYVNKILGYMEQLQSGGEISSEDIQAKQQALREELENLHAFKLKPSQLLKMQAQLYDTYNENVPRKFRIGGPKLSPELKLYKDYITGKDESQKAEKNYDKLNRVYYKKAKMNNMHPSNYIMTTMIS